MRRIARTSTWLLFAGLVTAAAGEAQQLAPTDSAGVYALTYTDIDGVSHTVRVEALNRVDPELSTTAIETSDGFRLELVLKHRDSDRSHQPILQFELPCPEVTALAAPEGWDARWEDHPTRGATCVFSSRGAPLPTGESAGTFVIEGPLGPGVATARVFGVAEAVYWTSEAGAVPEEAYALAGTVRGRVGGWLDAPVVALVGERTVEAALDRLLEELAGFCADGDIRPQGVCTSLEAKLRAAATAHAAGDVDTAIRNLESALHEVEALPDSRIEPHARDRIIAGIEAALSLLV